MRSDRAPASAAQLPPPPCSSPHLPCADKVFFGQRAHGVADLDVQIPRHANERAAKVELFRTLLLERGVGSLLCVGLELDDTVDIDEGLALRYDKHGHVGGHLNIVEREVEGQQLVCGHRLQGREVSHSCFVQLPGLHCCLVHNELQE